MIISSDVGATILDTINLSRYEVGSFSYSIREKILKGEKFLLIQILINHLMIKYFLKA